MDDAGFILGAYAVTFGSIAVYAVMAIRRARLLARQVPDDDKPWT